MSDVLSRIFGPANVASGTSTIFTGTASHIYTIKKIMVLNNSGAAISVKLGIGGVADANLILPYVSIGAGEWIEFDGLFVLTGTETFQANASASGLTITAHGLDQGALAPGSVELVYAYTVTGSDKASIDTGVDTADAGSGVWSNGDVLEIVMLLRTDDAAALVDPVLTVNNDTGSNYDLQVIAGQDTSVAAATSLAQTGWKNVDIHGSGGSASYPSVVRISIPGYASTTFNKVGEATSATNDATAGNNIMRSYALGWRSTSAITRFKVAGAGSAKLKVGSQLLIYKRKRTA